MSEITVILCTFNPRPAFMRRVLDGLRQQTLSSKKWELLIVDNASTPPLSDLVSLEWHPNARIVVERTPGLTPARLAGIDQSNAKLLVFVDDDAVLAPDYLEQALEIANSHPWVGAFGGSIELEFQRPPPSWTKPHWPRLAERAIRKPEWSNFLSLPETTPWGVGMCLQRQVAIKYSSLVKEDPVRLALDRKGNSLVSGGDDDMARTSHLIGLATGLFPELGLLHLIPDERLEEDYLVRLIEGQSYSGVVVDVLHGKPIPPILLAPLRRALGRLRRQMMMPRRRRLLFEARLRGEQNAIRDLRQSQNMESC